MDQFMSELDKVFGEIAAKRAEHDRERRERLRLAGEFLQAFFEQDIRPSQTLKQHGIEGSLIDNKIVLARPVSAHYSDPLYIVVGEQGEIDVGGRSFGRYQPGDGAVRKRELIGEIIKFFDL
jgi:hypothetical protein